jgi:hypothetical protein
MVAPDARIRSDRSSATRGETNTSTGTPATARRGPHRGRGCPWTTWSRPRGLVGGEALDPVRRAAKLERARALAMFQLEPHLAVEVRERPPGVDSRTSVRTTTSRMRPCASSTRSAHSARVSWSCFAVVIQPNIRPFNRSGPHAQLPSVRARALPVLFEHSVDVNLADSSVKCTDVGSWLTAAERERCCPWPVLSAGQRSHSLREKIAAHVRRHVGRGGPRHHGSGPGQLSGRLDRAGAGRPAWSGSRRGTGNSRASPRTGDARCTTCLSTPTTTGRSTGTVSTPRCVSAEHGRGGESEQSHRANPRRGPRWSAS